MDIELNAEQQRALDAATDAPARVAVAGTDEVHVLLPEADLDWLRGQFPDAPDAVWATDPRAGKRYALVPISAYERFKALFEEDPITPAERKHLLREAGLRAGWNDPIWDDVDLERGKEE